MLKKAEETIKKYNMIQNGDKIVAALSGGADSVALLCFLCELRKKLDISVYAVHVNHGIRGKEADGDCEFCQKLCQRLGVEIFVKNADIPKIAAQMGMGSEEAGRKVRYEAFNEVMKKTGAKKTAVAHNLNDNAETVIMRICRGSGAKGLRGIPPVRGNIIRPLINCSRADIEKYLKEINQTFRTDSTNLEDEYTRNRIRHHILPAMEKNINSSAIFNISKAAEIISEDEDFIENYAMAVLKKCLLKADDEKIEIDAEYFSKQHRAVKKRIVRIALEKLTKSSKDITTSHVESVIDIFQGKTGRSYSLPYSVIAEKSYEKAVLRKEKAGKKEFFYALSKDEVFVKEAGVYVSLSDTKPENGEYRCIDIEKAADGFFVRNRQNGDRICINKDGRSRKIKDILIDLKVPKNERDFVPVIGCKKGIIWAYPYRSSSYFGADEKTNKKIYITIRRV